MKPLRNIKSGFSMLELAVVIAIIAILISIFIPAHTGEKVKAKRTMCANNLKQIGAGYRIWAYDSSDRNVITSPNSEGGWQTTIAGPNPEQFVWTNYFL